MQALRSGPLLARCLCMRLRTCGWAGSRHPVAAAQHARHLALHPHQQRASSPTSAHVWAQHARAMTAAAAAGTSPAADATPPAPRRVTRIAVGQMTAVGDQQANLATCTRLAHVRNKARSVLAASAAMHARSTAITSACGHCVRVRRRPRGRAPRCSSCQSAFPSSARTRQRCVSPSGLWAQRATLATCLTAARPACTARHRAPAVAGGGTTAGRAPHAAVPAAGEVRYALAKREEGSAQPPQGLPAGGACAVTDAT